MKPSQCRFLIGSFLIIFIWSAIKPHDYPTWVLEVFPAAIGLILLLTTYRRFPFTRLVYVLIWVHAIILVIGGHYTYAEVPLFNWLRDTFELSRNHYDRLGHFAQGFVPALIAREILIRRSPLKPGKWLFFIVISICLAISAAYELLEWLVAEISEQGAEAFLGTQGDHWDTQKDMALALLGSVLAQVFLAKRQDRQMSKMHI